MNADRDRTDKLIDEISRLQQQVRDLRDEITVKAQLIDLLRDSIVPGVQ